MSLVYLNSVKSFIYNSKSVCCFLSCNAEIYFEISLSGNALDLYTGELYHLPRSVYLCAGISTISENQRYPSVRRLVSFVSKSLDLTDRPDLVPIVQSVAEVQIRVFHQFNFILGMQALFAICKDYQNSISVRLFKAGVFHMRSRKLSDICFFEYFAYEELMLKCDLKLSESDLSETVDSLAILDSIIYYLESLDISLVGSILRCPSDFVFIQQIVDYLFLHRRIDYCWKFAKLLPTNPPTVLTMNVLISENDIEFIKDIFLHYERPYLCDRDTFRLLFSSENFTISVVLIRLLQEKSPEAFDLFLDKEFFTAFNPHYVRYRSIQTDGQDSVKDLQHFK